MSRVQFDLRSRKTEKIDLQKLVNFRKSRSHWRKKYMKKMLKNMGRRLAIFGELWAFMRVRKKWWLLPIIVTLLLLGLLVIFTESSAIAPFIYTLF